MIVVSVEKRLKCVTRDIGKSCVQNGDVDEVGLDGEIWTGAEKSRGRSSHFGGDLLKTVLVDLPTSHCLGLLNDLGHSR